MTTEPIAAQGAHGSLHRTAWAAGRRRLLTASLLAALPALWAVPTPLRAAEVPRSALRVPFDQQLDLDAVRSVALSPPGDLLATIAQHGVEVLRVRTEAPTRPVNPLLASLPEAPADLLRQAEFREGYDGRIVLRASTCCPRPRDLILIRDTALTYTLIHEFAQSRLQPLQGGEPDDVVELRFAAAFRRLSLYQRRLYDDPYRLLEPLWRRDILAAQSDVAGDLFARLRLGQSQEAIIERVLVELIDERSPYFDAARREEGLLYARLMIDNAIDIFNAVHESAVFVTDAVSNLRAAIVEGVIPAEAQASLTDADVATVRSATDQVHARLGPVRTEIQALKELMRDVLPAQRAAADIR